jgi:hypothetical protein
LTNVSEGLSAVFFRAVSQFLCEYIAQYPGRQASSYSPPCELEISFMNDLISPTEIDDRHLKGFGYGIYQGTIPEFDWVD